MNGMTLTDRNAQQIATAADILTTELVRLNRRRDEARDALTHHMMMADMQRDDLARLDDLIADVEATIDRLA